MNDKKSAFGFEQPEDSPGFLLWKSTTTWQRLIKKALEPYDISHAQFVVMAMVMWFKENHQPATQVNIAQLSGLDKMTVSKSLKKLSQLALIARVEDSTDTRAKLVSLTAEGQKLIAKLIPIVESTDRIYFNSISIPEQNTLIALFRKLNKD